MRKIYLVLLGSEGVGKSALLRRFTTDYFVDESKYNPCVAEVDWKNVDVDNQQCSLQMIDFGHEYTAILRMGQGFVLVYSVTQQSTFYDLTDLRQLIFRTKNTVDVPIILVGNKCDLEDDRNVGKEYGADLALAWGCDFLETSAKKNENVNEVFYNLVRQINNKKTVKKRKKCSIL